jgi:GT2 family glycosyltransferase
VLRYEDPRIIDRAGDEMSWSGEANGRGAGEHDRGQYDVAGPVFCACAGVGLFRMAAFEAIGMFDDQFFGFHEDTDWGLRARLAGWTSVYTPTAVARHVGGATFGTQSEFVLYHGLRNSVWTIAKNYPASSLLRHAPELLWRHAAILFHNVLGRRPGLVARAWRDAARGLPAIIAKRREVQRLRTADHAALDAAFRIHRSR